MKKFSIIGIAISTDKHTTGSQVEDTNIIADNLPNALRQYTERLEKGHHTLDLQGMEILVIAGVSAEKADQLERAIKN